MKKIAFAYTTIMLLAMQSTAADTINIVSSDKVDTDTKSIGKTIVVDVKKQDWQIRRVEYINALKQYSKNPNDKNALNTIDKALTNYEKQPWSITPMEAMDLLQTFYVPREGIKTMSMIVAEAILGYRDTLQWASKSGKSEIIWNEQFLIRALTNGGKNQNTMNEWLKFVEQNEEEAKKIVDSGVKFAKLINSAKDGYDRRWPTAYGLERMINSMENKPDKARTSPNMSDEQALEEAIAKIYAYYLPKKKPQN